MSQHVYTIGHSNHTAEAFLELLRTHTISAVADVRSKPRSSYNPQFDREMLTATLKKHGISYVFLGFELGARSNDPDCYEHGKVKYDRLARTKTFQAGLERIRTGAESHRIALMCAEKEPLECHRTILVTRQLCILGFTVDHIHADGHLESHHEAMLRLCAQLRLRENEHHLFRTDQDLLDDAYSMQEKRIAYEQEALPDAPAA
jgi:uncharacterized protein (DUF488 family)